MELFQKFSFNVDLIEGSKKHVAFLKILADNDVMQADLRHALYRYEKYWLPLAASYPNNELSAPLDVEWIWHCHMLCPLRYQQDCMKLVGTLVDHKLYSTAELRVHQGVAQFLWEQMYPGVPFDPLPMMTVPKDFQSKLSYDVVSAASRQKSFLYHVSLPHFTDLKFLEAAENRYRKFLYLKQQNPELFVVPTYDIDLLWHTHQLHPLRYKEDTERILGRTLDHDDSVSDRSRGSKQAVSEAMTREAWQKEFGESYALCGAMYRGEAPEGKLYQATPEDTLALSEVKIFCDLEKLEIKGFASKKMRTTVHVGTKCYNMKRIKSPIRGTSWIGNPYCHFIVKSKSRNFIGIQVEKKSGCSCIGDIELVGEAYMNPFSSLDLLSKTTVKKELCADMGRATATVSLSITPVSECEAKLMLHVGHFTKAVMPVEVDSMWGPVPRNQLPAGVVNECDVTSHRLVNLDGFLQMTCRVIHSLPMMQSVVQVFHRDKMAAVAHLIGTEQLPLPNQVTSPESCPYLNPKTGERAVLIKNNTGDWGVLVGRWKGFRIGQPGGKGPSGSPGTLIMRLWRFRPGGGRWEMFGMKYNLKSYVVTLGDLTANLKSGDITIRTTVDNGQVAENVALLFSVSLLHVLCVPRYNGWAPGKPIQPILPPKGKQPHQSPPMT
ncbi:uncharacterized protein LOC112559134 [Pomacea canaliculata]|uniref:uncharacterized protein LOC112559134 n=1 Tax=Pomacea canaliculata TaxID=400727 RepID=UPI000D736B9F|nr:uncharacterized protein LOC112559134 [Pomacea canaliculata]